jgi:hypothetical protein
MFGACRCSALALSYCNYYKNGPELTVWIAVQYVECVKNWTPRSKTYMFYNSSNLYKKNGPELVELNCCTVGWMFRTEHRVAGTIQYSTCSMIFQLYYKNRPELMVQDWMCKGSTTRSMQNPYGLWYFNLLYHWSSCKKSHAWIGLGIPSPAYPAVRLVDLAGLFVNCDVSLYRIIITITEVCIPLAPTLPPPPASPDGPDLYTVPYTSVHVNSDGSAFLCWIQNRSRPLFLSVL